MYGHVEDGSIGGCSLEERHNVLKLSNNAVVIFAGEKRDFKLSDRLETAVDLDEPICRRKLVLND